MVRRLKEIEDSRLEVVCADATDFPLCSFGPELKVTGNLPYNVASLIVENVVRHRSCIPLSVLMLQKEVAFRLLSEKSWLAVLVSTFYRVEYLMTVPPRFFTPKPKVESGVVRLARREELPPIDTERYKKFLLRLFSGRRKMLRKKIPEDILKKAGIDPKLRVEQISSQEILRLYNVYEER